MTIADSTARGSWASRPAAATTKTSTTTAAATLLTWVNAPARALAAVFDRDPPTPIPPNSPEARLAAPVATNSRSSAAGSLMSVPFENVRAAASPSAIATAPMASPPVTIAGHCPRSSTGSPGSGSPLGMSPTTTTPRPASPSRSETTIPATSTTSDHGTRGASREPTNSTTRAPTPSARVSAWNSGRSRAMATSRSRRLPFGLGSPDSPGSSPTTMSTTSPATNPATIGSERNCATQPARSSPTTSSATPAVSASAEVSCTAISGSPPDRPRTIDPDSTDTVDTGPTKSSREEPKSA